MNNSANIIFARDRRINTLLGLDTGACGQIMVGNETVAKAIGP